MRRRPASAPASTMTSGTATRVNVLDGEPLYVCQHQMARGHWGIIKHGPSGAREGGSPLQRRRRASSGPRSRRPARSAPAFTESTSRKATAQAQSSSSRSTTTRTSNTGVEDQVGNDELRTRVSLKIWGRPRALRVSTQPRPFRFDPTTDRNALETDLALAPTFEHSQLDRACLETHLIYD
jgi:hypothetical protein